jgi:hypothetical protein
LNLGIANLIKKDAAFNCNKFSFETGCPSPDGRENPFVPGFGTKDWKDSRKQLLK